MKIVIDGNIGSGKSNVLTNFSNAFLEPIDEWKDWLKLFYKEEKYAFGFQMKVLKSHLDNKKFNGLFERSPLSCVEIFGKVLYEDKLINTLEWQLMNEYYYSYGWYPDIIYYLQCSPEICYNRIKNRNRNSEDSISLEYITKIHNKYEEIYNNKKLLPDNIKINIIDASLPPDIVYNQILSTIHL